MLSTCTRCIGTFYNIDSHSLVLQDKEVSCGAHAPRILALDDYFLTEIEKSEKDPETGKKVKKKVGQVNGFLVIRNALSVLWVSFVVDILVVQNNKFTSPYIYIFGGVFDFRGNTVVLSP